MPVELLNLLCVFLTLSSLQFSVVNAGPWWSAWLRPSQKNPAHEEHQQQPVDGANRRTLPTNGILPRIYVYNLSEAFRNDSRLEVARGANMSLYALELLFPQMLLDSPYVTSNPEEADYFYVWSWSYFGEIKEARFVIEELRRLGPWWDRRGGSDHLWAIGYDMGKCEHYFTGLASSVGLVHWGKVSGVVVRDPCDLTQMWGEACDQQMIAAFQDNHAIPHPTPCYKQGLDLLVPPPTSENERNTRYLNPALDALPQDEHLIMFGGGLGNKTHRTDPKVPELDAGYSFGARQTFVKMFQHYPGVKILGDIHANYWETVAKSTFCFAPPGWGWGARVKGAITAGCIPVIVSDGIKVDWEDELPLSEFAIRVPFMFLHKLPQILHKFIRLGKVAEMKQRLQCIWRLFWWHRPHGRAFEMSMCALKARMLSGRVFVNWRRCSLLCGDQHEVFFNPPANFTSNLTGIYSV